MNPAEIRLWYCEQLDRTLSRIVLSSEERTALSKLRTHVAQLSDTDAAKLGATHGADGSVKEG